MRRLLPAAAEAVEPSDPYPAAERPPRADRPWVLVNTITSADGATAHGGVSAPLSSPADKAVFGALRRAADVVLVGAATARAEDYGLARPRPDGTPGPRLAVVTRSGDLDPESRLLTTARPLVLTCDACPRDRRTSLEDAGAEVVIAGGDHVELPTALVALRQRGAAVVVCEGGPSLNGQLVAEDLVDEWCLTTAPVLAAGSSARAAVGPGVADLRVMRLDTLLEADGELYARYVRDLAGTRE